MSHAASVRAPPLLTRFAVTHPFLAFENKIDQSSFTTFLGSFVTAGCVPGCSLWDQAHPVGHHGCRMGSHPPDWCNWLHRVCCFFHHTRHSSTLVHCSLPLYPMTDTRYGVAICALMLAYAKGLMRDEDCEPTEIFTEGFLPAFATFLVCCCSSTQHTNFDASLTHKHTHRSHGPHRTALSTREDACKAPLFPQPQIPIPTTSNARLLFFIVLCCAVCVSVRECKLACKKRL